MRPLSMGEKEDLRAILHGFPPFLLFFALGIAPLWVRGKWGEGWAVLVAAVALGLFWSGARLISRWMPLAHREQYCRGGKIVLGGFLVVAVLEWVW